MIKIVHRAIVPPLHFLHLPLYKAVCKIYAAAVKAATHALPWIRAADIWHLSSVPNHETVFEPTPPRLPKSSSTSSTVRNHASMAAKEDVLKHQRASARGEAVIGASDVGTPSITLGNHSHASVGSDARFREKVIGKTWSGSPTIVLRSLRSPGRNEALRAARWLRGTDDADEWNGCAFGDDDGWTNQRLRLLAEEWRVCAGLETASRSSCVPSSHRDYPDLKEPDLTATHPRPTNTPRIFTVHTGHLIVPFLNARVQKKGGDMVGHGVVLAVDRRVDWRPWESHLIELATTATRCFECLESQGAAIEKSSVNAWASTLLHGGGLVGKAKPA